MTERIASLDWGTPPGADDDRHAAPAPETPAAPRARAKTPLRFRPHHFLCSLGFAGAGYDDDFTVNMEEIVMGLLRAHDGDGVEIEVVAGTDAICAPCPNNLGQDCAKSAKVNALDARHAAALALVPGERLSWGAAKARIRERVKPGDLTGLCAGCEWLELGLCEAALAQLHRQT